MHNAAGKVTQAAAFQSRELPKARIEVSQLLHPDEYLY